MYPVRALSINDGWGFLSNKKAVEWQEIKDMLLLITPESINDAQFMQNFHGRINKRPILNDLGIVWDRISKQNGWGRAVNKPQSKSKRTFTIRNTKNGVATRVLTRDKRTRQDLYKFIFIEAPRARNMGLCELFVVLVPTDDSLGLYADKISLQGKFSNLMTESICRLQLSDLEPLDTNISFVIIFFSHENESLSVEELSAISPTNNLNVVERAIEFPPEFYQAGVSALSYFGQILRQKYPDINANVRIEQLPDSVRMHIHLPSGETEVVERALERYMMVVKGDAEAKDLLDNKFHIASLENKIDSLKAEANSNYRLYQLALDNNKSQERSYESIINQFNIILNRSEERNSGQEARIERLTTLLEKKEANHNQLQIAYIGHSNSIFSGLVESSAQSEKIALSIRSLEQSIIFSTNANQSEIMDAIDSIKYKQPNLLSSLLRLVENAGYGVAGNIGYELLKQAAQ